MASPANLTSHVAPLQPTYLPGDTFKATWEVAYPATPTTDANVNLQDIKISVIGSEIVDPKWVSKSYHAVQPAVSTSSRRVTRHIFHSKGTIATSALVLRPGELRRTALAVPLPRILPPSFSGTSLRFAYHVHVSWTADFQTSDALPASASLSASLNTARAESGHPDAAYPPSEPSASQAASQALSYPPSPATRRGADCNRPGSAVPGASPAVSTAGVGGGLQDSTRAVGAGDADGKTASRAGSEADHPSPNGKMKPPASRSWLNLRGAAAAAPGSLAARMGLSRTSSSSTALPPPAAAAVPAAAAAAAELPPPAERLTRGAHSTRAQFRVGIAPAEALALATVAESEADACPSPRGSAMHRSGSFAMGALAASLGSGGLSGPLPSGVPAAYDPVQGPLIDFPMVSPDDAAPVATEVLPALPIGAEHVLWGSAPMATEGHRFLWAPNEADEAPALASLPGSVAPTPGGSRAAGASGGGSGGMLMHDASIPDSADGRLSALDGSMADGEAQHGALALDAAGSGDLVAGSYGSGSPAYRHSEAGTPRVAHRGGPASERGTADPRVFHLAFRGADLARVELHTSHEGPLYPGCTFSVTVDFRAADGAARRRAACHQVVVVLETEEQVAREWLPAAVARRVGTTNGIRRAYDVAQEAALHTLFTSFMLTVPRDAPAAFRTPLLALRWVLRFEFSVVAPRSAAAAASPGRWPAEEELLWRMPLPVAPVGSVPVPSFG
eukprot:jgi/Ulvmu1/12127/UM084_0054.1